MRNNRLVRLMDSGCQVTGILACSHVILTLFQGATRVRRSALRAVSKHEAAVRGASLEIGALQVNCADDRDSTRCRELVLVVHDLLREIREQIVHLKSQPNSASMRRILLRSEAAVQSAHSAVAEARFFCAPDFSTGATVVEPLVVSSTLPRWLLQDQDQELKKRQRRLQNLAEEKPWIKMLRKYRKQQLYLAWKRRQERPTRAKDRLVEESRDLHIGSRFAHREQHFHRFQKILQSPRPVRANSRVANVNARQGSNCEKRQHQDQAQDFSFSDSVLGSPIGFVKRFLHVLLLPCHLFFFFSSFAWQSNFCQEWLQRRAHHHD